MKTRLDHGRRTNFLFLLLKIVLLSLLVLTFQACAHIPEYDSSYPQVAISAGDSQSLLQFGKDYSTNPFLEPRSLLRGKLNEFYIIRIHFNLQEESRVSILAEMSSKDGSSVASPYYRDYLKEYWEIYAERGAASANMAASTKRNVIDNYVPVSSVFIQKAGQTDLYLPMIGPNPIPRPANIYIQVSVNRGEPVLFEAELR